MKRKFLVKIFSVFIINVISISILWYFIINEVNTSRSNIIKAFMKQQYLRVVEISDKVQASFKTSEEKKVLKKEVNSKNNYMFLYSSKGVIFERNDSITSSYNNKSLKQFFSMLEYKGGYDLSNMKRSILRGEAGYDEVVKDNSVGKEILAWYPFKVGNDTYIVGASTSETYLMNETCFDQHTTRIYIISLLFTACLLCISFAFSMHLYVSFNNLQVIKKTLRNKNIEIEKFIEKLAKEEGILKRASIHDSLTGVYNMEFFYKCLKKLNISAFLPIAFIVLEVRNASERNLCETAKSLYGNEIVSRIDYNKFVVVKVNTNREEAFKLMDDIRGKTSCALRFGISVKKEEDGETIMNLRSAFEKVNL
ncbi:GGDEF domain-containing protein [Clostridium felsineum]|uniref:GGDEF domain-containing protein n=1 Tax=Clostridium felsineum TaxID=36839 RepID=UPI00214D9C37|nr:GGDEF domain-containing protein [Clostridium felsineum]MCR3760337.1 GGDEF domain-containing protein [Clostridium felsineum]